MTRRGRRALRLLALLTLAVLLIWFARSIDWRSAARAIRAADPALLAIALVINLLSLSLKGVRWWVFLRPLGVRSLSLVLRATFAGASLNNLLVAQGGEGARVLLVSRATGVSSARVLAALALERTLDAVSYLVLLVSAAWLLPLPPQVARWRTPASGALALVALSLALLARRSSRVTPSAGVIAGRLQTYFRAIGGGLGVAATPGRLTVAMVLSLAAWALQVATYHLTAVAAHLPLPLTGSVAAMLAVGISFLLRATPGNVGVFQVIYAITARSFGILEAPAVATGILIQTLQVIPTMLVGAVVAPQLARDAPLSS